MQCRRKKPEQATLVGVEHEETETAVAAVPATRLAWPKELPEQVRLVAQALADARVPLTEDAIATRLQGRGPWKKRLPQIIDTLIAVGRVHPVEGVARVTCCSSSSGASALPGVRLDKNCRRHPKTRREFCRESFADGAFAGEHSTDRALRRQIGEIGLLESVLPHQESQRFIGC